MITLRLLIVAILINVWFMARIYGSLTRFEHPVTLGSFSGYG